MELSLRQVVAAARLAASTCSFTVDEIAGGLAAFVPDGVFESAKAHPEQFLAFARKESLKHVVTMAALAMAQHNLTLAEISDAMSAAQGDAQDVSTEVKKTISKKRAAKLGKK